MTTAKNDTPNIKLKIENLVSEFSQIKSWEDRYKKVIKMGKEISKMPEDHYDEKYLVKGCQSQVWLVARPGTGGTVHLLGDSDAMIVKGLVAVLLNVYAGESPDAILENPPKFLEELGFQSHLSQSRANGLMSMVKQIQMYAAALKALA